MSVLQRAVGIGLLYLLTIGTGIWLTNLGRPLNMLIFTVHKLIALATVVLTSMLLWRLLRHIQMDVPLLGLIIALAVLAIALFATGALLSATKPVNNLLLTIHRVAPGLLVLSTGAAIYLSIK